MGCRACDHDRKDHGEDGLGPCMKPHDKGLGMCGCYGYIPVGRNTCDNTSCPSCFEHPTLPPKERKQTP